MSTSYVIRMRDKRHPSSGPFYLEEIIRGFRVWSHNITKFTLKFSTAGGARNFIFKDNINNHPSLKVSPHKIKDSDYWPTEEELEREYEGIPE